MEALQPCLLPVRGQSKLKVLAKSQKVVGRWICSEGVRDHLVLAAAAAAAAIPVIKGVEVERIMVKGLGQIARPAAHLEIRNKTRIRS